jgi:hypothetical protein
VIACIHKYTEVYNDTADNDDAIQLAILALDDVSGHAGNISVYGSVLSAHLRIGEADSTQR